MSFGTVSVVVLVAFLLYRMFAGSSGQVSVEEAKSLVQSGALLVDVRTPEEFAAGHIQGAKNIPLAELGRRLKELGDPAQPLVVYCRSGNRSGKASGLLQEAGFRQVKDLGAMSRW